LPSEIEGLGGGSTSFYINTNSLGTFEFYVHYSLPTGLLWSTVNPSGFLIPKFTVNVICGSETLTTPKGKLQLNLINGKNEGQQI
jgi:hypothetical protein